MAAANPEVNARNILAIKDHSEYTRAIVREIEVKLAAMQNEIVALRSLSDQTNERISAMQVRVYSGRATS